MSGAKGHSRFSRRISARVSLAVAASALALATQAQADTNYYFKGTGSGLAWDTTSDLWASPLSTSLPLTTWTNSSTSDAIFSTSPSITVNTPITANSITFTQSGKVTFLGTGPITLNSIFNTLGSQSALFNMPLMSSGQLVIHGVTYPNSNGKGIELGADTNMLDGGILITGGSVYLNLDNSANRYAVDPTHLGGVSAATLNSPGGIIPGSTAQNAPILLTSVSGPGGTFPAITVDGNGSTITMGAIHTNDYLVPNPIVLNPSNAANFYTAIGAGSVGDSGSVAAGPYPAYAVMNFTGQISGDGNVIISNDFYGGGGKGFTIFSNPNNTYTGKTIINNNAQNYLTFQVGAVGAVPSTTDLVFGAKSLGQAIGDTSITGKQVGAFDLNGFDQTVKTLSSDMPSNLYCLGITAVNNHGIDPNLSSGPHAVDNSTCTLTIDSGGAANNSFFQGNIADGSDFLTQANATSGTYKGPYGGNASNYLIPSNGLKVAITLAATNSGTLTLTAVNGSTGNTPNIPDYGYTGGTTVSGGSLYVNGPLSAPSGCVSSQVLVTTPLAGHIALLGGTGTINPDIHIQSGATLAPGSAPAPLASGSGTDFSNGPSSFNTGTLTVKNLTMDSGSQMNVIVNDGSDVAVAGVGYATLAFSNGGTFTPNGTITVNIPGAFSGFSDAAFTSWTLATLPTNFSLSNFTLGNIALTSGQLGGGTLSLQQVNNLLELVFTPSANVTVLQYAGSANGTWNTNPSNTVWTNVISGTPNQSYSEPLDNLPNILFGTPTANTTITVQVGGVSPQSVSFKNGPTFEGAAVSYTITGGSINGTTSLALKAPGHVILAATNAYTGGTAIYSGGTLETQIAGALGTGAIAINNGTWATTTTDQTYANNVQVAGNSTATPATTSTIQTGPTSGSPSGNLTLTGNVTGAGTLTKTGLGTLTINGSLLQGGDLVVNGGNVLINGTPAYAGTTKVLAGAGIEYNTTANATIGYQSSASLAGNLTFDNVTNITFSPGTYSGTGNINLRASGTLVQGVGGQIGGSPVDIGNSIVLNSLNNVPNFVAYIGMAGNGNQFFLHGPITGNGDVSFGAGPGQGGGANIELFARSTFTGNTHLDTGGKASVILETDNALPATTQLTFGTNGQGSGFVDLNGHNQTIAGISTDPLGGGFGGLTDSSGGGSLTVNGSTSGEFKALISGFLTLNVALQNNAVLDLSWQGDNGTGTFGNIFAGQTVVTSGVIRFSNTLSLSPNQNMVLNGGVLEIHANGFGNFTNALGGGPGQIRLIGGASGFSAFGSQPAFFNLNGGGSVTWGSTFFQPSSLVLNQTTATNTITFQNDVDLGGAARTIAVNSTLAGTTAIMTGNISDGGLVKEGPGTLILSGNNTYSGGTTVNSGLLQFTAAAAISSGDVTVNTGGTFDLSGFSPTVGGLNGTGGTINSSSGTTVTLTIGNNNASGSYAGTISDDAVLSLVKIGSGSQTLTGTNTYSGGTSIVGGTLAITNAGALGSGNVAIHDTGTLKLQTGSTNAVKFGASKIGLDGGIGHWAGSIDLTNSKLIIEDSVTHATTLATMKDQVNFAVNNSDSAGIFASGQASGKVAVVLDNSVENLSIFGNVNVDDNSILALAAYPGDTNLDGQVNITDLNTLAAHWQAHVSAWTLGDFNGDGVVNISDLNSLAANWQKGVGAGAGSGESFSAALASIGGFGGVTVSSVPEPASLALLAVGGLLLAKRRRR